VAYVQRRLLCDCGFEWSALCLADEPNPECPVCREVARRIPGRLNKRTARSKAIDYVQQMAEQDYGLTDFNDNQREGDIAFKAPAEPSTAETEALIREAMQGQSANEQQVAGALHMLGMKKAADVWTHPGAMTPTPSNVGMGGGPSVPSFDPGQAGVARSEGFDPIGMLHDAGAKGALGPGGMPLTVVASDKPRRRKG
jgi:hypothetical protein